VIVFWGSTKGPLLESLRYVKKPVKLVQIVWLEPFDTKKVAKELLGARKIIDVECNHDGQLGALIREKTGIAETDQILRFDSRPFEPITLAEEINKIIKA
jgi:2-oxoglutarate ferredoxin oxidoreductase subunit alpha